MSHSSPPLPNAPIPDAATAAPAAPTWTAQQLQEVALAKVRAKKIRRAVTTAKIDGGITAFFAVTCVLSVCLGWEGPVLGVALAAVAANSFRGAAKLARFDRAAPAILGMNQLYLATAIIVYAVYSLYASLSGGSGQLKAVLGDTSNLGITPELDWLLLQGGIYWLVYGGLIAGTILAQGLTALYYFTQAKALAEYLTKTPPWVVQFQAASA